MYECFKVTQDTIIQGDWKILRDEKVMKIVRILHVLTNITAGLVGTQCSVHSYSGFSLACVNWRLQR